MCFLNSSFCFLSCFFSLFVIYGTLSFVLAILLGTNLSRALSSSVMRSFHILSIGVSKECEAMNESLTVGIQSLTSVTSAVIVPKIIVGHCGDFVAVNVPAVALITVYFSVSPAYFPCATSTWIVCWQGFTCVVGVLFK